MSGYHAHSRGGRPYSDDECAHDEKHKARCRGCRPLVVIDPADAEQVKRLYDAWMFAEGEGARGRDIASLALRGFASPTPEECGAFLNIAGVQYPCEGPEGHTCAHGNDDARAIWRTA